MLSIANRVYRQPGRIRHRPAPQAAVGAAMEFEHSARHRLEHFLAGELCGQPRRRFVPGHRREPVEFQRHEPCANPSFGVQCPQTPSSRTSSRHAQTDSLPSRLTAASIQPMDAQVTSQGRRAFRSSITFMAAASGHLQLTQLHPTGTNWPIDCALSREHI